MVATYKLLNFGFEKFSEKEEREKNILSINLASEKVLKGGLVIMFPNPHCQKWYSGIGWLLKNLKGKAGVYYVKAYVGGTSNFDYLRSIPNIGRFLPKIKVHFGKPQKIADFESRDPKQLTAKLEKEYFDWTTSL